MKTTEEILEAVKELQKANPHDEGIQNWIADNFPELCESEDEKIKKDVLAFIRREGQHIDKYKWNKWIAWLEKQGEHKSIEPTDLKTWKYIVDAVLTRWNGIGQYLDNPYTEEIAIKLRERFCGIEKEIVDSRISNSRNGKEYGEALHNLDIVATLVSNWKDEPSRITEDGKLIMDNDAIELLIKTNRSFRRVLI